MSKEIVVYQQKVNTRNGNPQRKQQPKKKNPQNKRPNRAARRAKMQRPQLNRFRLSRCALEYLVALANPGSLKLSNPCIPDLNERPSSKIKTIIRGTFVTGTTGFGYVLVSPKAATQDGTSHVTTLQTYVSTGIQGTGLGTVPHGNATFPYTEAQMTDGSRSARLVGCGVKVSYIGTDLNMGGRYIVGRLPTDSSGTNTFVPFLPSDILGKQDFRPYPMSRAWRGISYLPMTATDYDYVSGAFQLTTSGQNGTIIIIADGCVTGSTFQFEITRWHELIAEGGSSLPNLTKTASDVSGASAIKNAMQDTNETPGDSYVQMLFNKISDMAPDDASGWVSSSKDVLTNLKTVKDLLR